LPSTPSGYRPSPYHFGFSKIDQHLTPERIEGMKDYKMLFVPGILYEVHKFLGAFRIARFLNLHQYFGDQMAWLRQQGIEAELVDVRSVSMAKNAGLIERAIAASDKPVILVTHSKGGLDALAALIGNRALQARVKGWLSLQTPFYGTPVADFLAGSRLLRPVMSAVAKVIGGSIDALDQLTTKAAEAYQKAHHDDIAELTQAIPVISRPVSRRTLRSGSTRSSSPSGT
jgi:triacylglycerol esterase/lipase EstA (alpha/beta hydrolase family)